MSPSLLGMYEPYDTNSLRPEQFCSTVPFNGFAVNDRVVFDWSDSGNSEFGGQGWGSLEASTIGNRVVELLHRVDILGSRDVSLVV